MSTSTQPPPLVSPAALELLRWRLARVLRGVPELQPAADAVLAPVELLVRLGAAAGPSLAGDPWQTERLRLLLGSCSEFGLKWDDLAPILDEETSLSATGARAPELVAQSGWRSFALAMLRLGHGTGKGRAPLLQ